MSSRLRIRTVAFWGLLVVLATLLIKLNNPNERTASSLAYWPLLVVLVVFLFALGMELWLRGKRGTERQ
jgi:drug/metabolite transporter (DMT)-like permease